MAKFIVQITTTPGKVVYAAKGNVLKYVEGKDTAGTFSHAYAVRMAKQINEGNKWTVTGYTSPGARVIAV